jgi:exodeoxyribonuclease-5
MSDSHWQRELQQNFPFEPTQGQEKVMHAISRLLATEKPGCALLIRGYAGTGKTTLVGATVNTCKKRKVRTILLAPTGRAAKVMSNYSSAPAHTIHKHIYQLKARADGSLGLSLAPNLAKNALFIIDEASMIGSAGLADGAGFGFRDLLDDLLQFVYSGKGCKLILIGDSAQLPPVGSDLSPALDLAHLKVKYPLNIASIELTEVMRQEKDSGILDNATRIRDQIRSQIFEFPQIDTAMYSDMVRVDGHELQDYLEEAYDRHGPEGVALITRSNKRANLFNMQIRSRVFWQEDTPAAGDLVMIVRNNYFWLEDFENAPTDFIANGDMAEILKIIRREKEYGLEFADVMIRLIDYPDIPPFEVKVMLDTLHEESPNLNRAKMQKLYEEVEESYLDLNNKKDIKKAIKKDPYYNALQIKFGYAVTCHKAQGGQWPAVFIDQGYLTEELVNLEFLRWLYTAFTRATEKLYLINFSPEFFPKE